MTTTGERPAATTTTHHWMITIQWTDADGHARTRTRAGTADLPPGTSRNDVANDLYARQTAAAGADPANTVVLFFSLEPDAL